MSQTIYVATTNPGKLRDFAAAAASRSKLQIVPLPGLGSIPAPSEDEPDFEGNAKRKAVYYSRFAPGEIVIADDSGLEVDALDGAPGVRSARYADDMNFDHPGATDERNNQCLLAKLATASGTSRLARYRCALAAASGGACLLTADGAVPGEILSHPRGSGGFGYDPLFYLPELGQTMAEISLTVKDRLSHRGLAFRRLLSLLAEIGE